MVNWLITGGCGFIGLRLLRFLLGAASNHRVRVLDNLSVGTQEQLAATAEFVKVETPSQFQDFSRGRVELLVGDILNEEIVSIATQDVDVVVHLAANTGVGPSVQDPRSDCFSNVLGTFNMLEASRHAKVKRFVFASSGAPIGEVTPPIHEELAPHPVSPYGASKLAGEGYCSAYFRTYGLETVALRFGNVYGPGSSHKGSVVAKFIRQALAGETLEIYGNGGQTRDFIYVDDLIRAIHQSATVPAIGGEVFQIATGQETTLQELTEQLLQELQSAGISDVTVRKSVPRLGDVLRNYSDTTKAKDRLGWKATTSLSEGLKQTINYFNDELVVE